MLPKANQVVLTRNQRNHKNKKQNTNQQILPTHNKDNENCDIADKREYEENLYKTTFLTLFQLPRILKNSLICLLMVGQDNEIRWKDEKIKITTHGKTSSKKIQYF